MALLWRGRLSQVFQALVRALESGIRLLGVLLVFLAVALIGLCVYVFYAFLLPVHYPHGGAVAACHLMVSAWIVANLTFNYVNAVLSDPGYPPSNDAEDLAAAKLKYPGHYRYCRHWVRKQAVHAGLPTPRLCRCIYKFDHHCQSGSCYWRRGGDACPSALAAWLNNCVGLYNHRYFILFMVYFCIACLYFVWFMYTPFRLASSGGPLPWSIPHMNRTVISLTFVLAATMFFSVGGLLAWNLYLVLTAQTAVEMQINQAEASDARLRGEVYANEYDVGTWRNLKDFLAVTPQTPWWFALLPVRVNPLSDGHTYLTVRSAFTYSKAAAAEGTDPGRLV